MHSIPVTQPELVDLWCVLAFRVDKPMPYDTLWSSVSAVWAHWNVSKPFRNFQSPDSSGQPKASAPPSDEALPDGWTAQVAANQRTFYIDHVNKVTTWIDPRTGVESESQELKEDEFGPLPEGWGKRVYADGRIFFVDHKNESTQVKSAS